MEMSHTLMVRCTARISRRQKFGETRTRRALILFSLVAVLDIIFLIATYCSLVYALRFRITSNSAVLVTRLAIPVYP